MLGTVMKMRIILVVTQFRSIRSTLQVCLRDAVTRRTNKILLRHERAHGKRRWYFSGLWTHGDEKL